MKLLLCALSVCCLVAVISAKKAVEENLDPLEPETREHSSKKYTKEHQKPHHHSGHKHKKHAAAEEQVPKAAESKPKDTPVEIPEPEVKLQSDLETSKKAIKKEEQRSNTEDLHLQDLAYEESLKKDKKKKGHHHGAHHAEVLEKPKGKSDHKLFAEEEAKTPEEKVIEDSFEPLKETRGKGKDKKSKDKSKGKKKASEKTKGKKSKDAKKKDKGKSKKSKDGKKW
ncbi:hypothetical protein JTE90_008118 [Oedothorax gibbosus]|uniref:Uncharacterized protein n=1 Tax=Oedothorax gibbosus TaxID=931172 RepID=A0AAV6UF68_9ARAC|nr:hypothetical protein JTE90_008118 [Oedothorax gibbosus]